MTEVGSRPPAPSRPRTPADDEPPAEPPNPEPPNPERPSATAPLRLVGYAALLVALAFSQAGGRMVADTKFDLVSDPLGFLGQSLRLWDPTAAYGQVQNQAYGYAWPMGPFFALGHLVQLPEWAIQRAWWSLLLLLAFFGVLTLARTLRIGTPATQVVAAFGFVLTPRITTLLGSTSIEVWPMALAPWVLVPLVRGSAQGSVRRAAALSALVVACCGGVNAVAVAAVLPLGVIWILTRAPGPRRWRLLGWWTGCTVLATAWWWGPLLLLGRYSVPFLDYIENATITTVPTDLTRTLAGVSNWVAYFAGYDYPAGRQIVSTPFILLDAVALAALGLLGVALRRAPHQRFLVLGVVTGLVLVGLGYAADLHGFFASSRQDALDGALAPLRNLHKFDVVLRIPLALGTAHALHRLPALLTGPGSRLARRAIRVATALALVALLFPWVRGNVATSGGVEQVPGYWGRVADYLAGADATGQAGGRDLSLVVPSASFGIYTWGNTHDDVMQGLARSPWAVRNVIPLAQPGNVVMLDQVTRLIESGRPGPALAAYLADNGVGHLVVRNDLDRLNTGAPDPAFVRGSLSTAPGLRLVRSFGPRVGSDPYVYASNGTTRLVTGNGLSARLRSVDVYAVARPRAATLTDTPGSLVGDPGSGATTALGSLPQVPRPLAADADDDDRALGGGQVLTDGMRRQETNFAAVRDNLSATMGAADAYRLAGPQHTHRVVTDLRRWQSTAIWTGGLVGAFASTSQGYADAVPPIRAGEGPAAALDRDPRTAWHSARHLDPTGQWWQLDLDGPLALSSLSVTLARDSAPVPRLAISLGGRRQVVDAPEPGSTATYALDLPLGRSLRITAAGRDLSVPGSLAISEVSLPGFDPQRFLSLPTPADTSPVDVVAVSRDVGTTGCVPVEAAFVCSPALADPGDDGDTLARYFRVSTSDRYAIAATASLRRSPAAAGALQRLLGVQVTTDGGSGSGDVATTPLAMVDDDAGTTWVATKDTPTVRVRLKDTVPLRSITLTTENGAAASPPSRVLVTAGERQALVTLDDQGRATLPGWRTRDFTLKVETTRPAFLVQGRQLVPAKPGVSELSVNDVSPRARRGSTVDVPCGRGPGLIIGQRVLRTAFSASVTDLVRGASVPLRVCGSDQVGLSPIATGLIARPTELWRLDGVLLTRQGAEEPRVRTLDVRRDARDLPQAVEVPERGAATLLTLPQNLNDGWQARLDGRLLSPERVDGWKQGWLLPAGDAGTVRLTYAPSGAFRTTLLLGALGVVLVLLVASPLRLRFGRRRPHPPALAAGRPAALDLVVLLAAGGLLAGWWGLAAVVVAGAAGRYLRPSLPWAAGAGIAVVVGGLGLTLDALERSSLAVTWSQGWAVLAVGLLGGVLAAARPAGPAGPPAEGLAVSET